MLSRISCFGKWTVNLHSAHRDDFYLLKSLIKLFIKAGVLSDLSLTIDYLKKLVLGIILKSSGATKSAPVS